MEENTCSWLVQESGHRGECYIPEELGWCVICEGIAEDGGIVIVECGAAVTEHPNGWECAAGHSHFSGVEYFDDDEVAGAAAAGRSLPANARRMDGSPV